MRDHSKHVEVNRDQAVEALLSHCSFAPEIESLPLNQACCRICAHDVLSLAEAPNALTCRMDSVAVHWEDFADGIPDTAGWQRGVEWQFANTGVAMPQGFDTAIVIENVVLSEDLSQISFTAAPSERFAGTSPAGSKMAEGELLVAKGQKLTPLLVSHLAAGNHTCVDVLKKPVVAFIPTGNELVHATDSENGVAVGKNIETNSLLIAAKIRQWGGEPLVWDIVPDGQESIKNAVVQACAKADIVVLNAGSSKGSDDWNVEMLEEVGQVLYHQTNHGPGHHSSGSVVDGTVVVGISGPPGGAAFTADFYLYPLIMRYLGQPELLAKAVVRLAEPFPGKPKRSGDKKPQPQGQPQPQAAAQAQPAAGKAQPAAGENRPSVVAESAEFFGVRQLRVRVGDDGVLEGYPATSSHLGPREASQMDAYFLASNLKPTPQPGEFIVVDLIPKG